MEVTPLRSSSAFSILVPLAARVASVFLMTLYLAPAERTVLRSSSACDAFNFENDVRIAVSALPNSAFSACACSNFFALVTAMSLSLPILIPRHQRRSRARRPRQMFRRYALTRAAASAAAVSIGMPGPIVELRYTPFRYLPLAAAGLALITLLITVAALSTSLLASNEILPTGT